VGYWEEEEEGGVHLQVRWMGKFDGVDSRVGVDGAVGVATVPGWQIWICRFTVVCGSAPAALIVKVCG
jgi:hypothetical protein